MESVHSRKQSKHGQSDRRELSISRHHVFIMEKQTNRKLPKCSPVKDQQRWGQILGWTDSKECALSHKASPTTYHWAKRAEQYAECMGEKSPENMVAAPSEAGEASPSMLTFLFGPFFRICYNKLCIVKCNNGKTCFTRKHSSVVWPDSEFFRHSRLSVPSGAGISTT